MANEKIVRIIEMKEKDVMFIPNREE